MTTLPPSIPVPTLIDHLHAVTEVYEQHPPAAQVNWMRSLGFWQLRRLWYLSERSDAPLRMVDLAPGDGVTICPGVNSLPVSAWFEKRFASVGGQIVGYNETGWRKAMVGPGHFTVFDGQRPDELIIDYTRPPEHGHAEFPLVTANTGFGWPGPLRGLVYGGLRDRLRRVSRHLLVGQAISSVGRGRPWYFALRLP